MVQIALVLLASQDPDFDAHFPGTDWVVLDPTDVEGQSAFQRFGDAFSRTPLDRWRESRSARSYGIDEPLAEGMTASDVRGHLEGLLARLESSASFDEHNGPRLRAHLAAELRNLLTLVPPPALGEDGSPRPLDWEGAKKFVTGRFQLESFDWHREDGTFTSDSVLFRADSTQVVLRIDRKPVLGASMPAFYYATIDQAIEVRAVAARVQELFGRLIQPRLEETALRLTEIDRGWSNYLERGFSQYPWESWANAHLTDFSWSRPPRDQWILVHPELGLVFDTRSSRSAEWESALLVHAVGRLRYFGDEREWFAGLSATASITGDSSYGLGFGPTLHLGYTGFEGRFPHLSLSLLWQDFENGDTEPVLGASIDLLRLLERREEGAYRSRLPH